MIYSYGERSLQTDGVYYIAPSADVIGSVSLGQRGEHLVWCSACAATTTGFTSVPAPMCRMAGIIHVDPGVPVVVGANVTIGHGVLLHGCHVGDGALIGNRAMVLDGARIGAGSLIGAGALITPNTEIPPGSVVMGAPGRIIRQIEPRDMERMTRGCEGLSVESARIRGEAGQSLSSALNTTTA